MASPARGRHPLNKVVHGEGSWCIRFDEKNAAFPFAKVAKQLENDSVDRSRIPQRGL